MKKSLLLPVLLFFVGSAFACEVLTGLVNRTLAPADRSRFVWAIDTTAKEDFFRVEGLKNGTVRISANSPVSAAYGLDWYLKNYCHRARSWSGGEVPYAALPKKLPVPVVPYEGRTRLPIHFYMNYCTQSYSMPFWTWADWEREIDRMAMSGVTTPMAMVGVESVWRATLGELGYPDEQIKRFLSGPAYMGWFLMGNLEGMGGPVSDTWIARQEELGKKIVARMRQYGMEPVFQAFFGMVPTWLSEQYFEADITPQGKWQNYDRPSVLNPVDPLFGRMAEIWYAKYLELYGPTRYWAGDLLHEGGKMGPIDMTAAGAAIEAAMQAAVPGSVWVIQSWGGNPRADLLEGLTKEHTLVVDLCAEYWARWDERNAFDNTPFLWGHITNWGGNIGLHGRLDAMATEPARAAKNTCMRGVAQVPEGIGTNPVTWDLVSDMRWADQPIGVDPWLSNYAAARYGAPNKVVDSAWRELHRTAYGTYQNHRRPSESVLCARPSLTVRTVSTWGSAAIFYDPAQFEQAVRLFASQYDKLSASDAYRYDLVDFTRQVVANRARTLYRQIVAAYKAQNGAALQTLCDQFMSLLAQQDQLLSVRKEFCLAPWIDQARAAASTPTEADLFEYNARALITTWSNEPSTLIDYAHREWSGLIRDYYAPRWKIYFDYLVASLNDPTTKRPDLIQFEHEWTHGHGVSQGVTPDLKQITTTILNR